MRNTFIYLFSIYFEISVSICPQRAIGRHKITLCICMRQLNYSLTANTKIVQLILYPHISNTIREVVTRVDADVVALLVFLLLKQYYYLL